MDLAADPVSYKFADDAKAVALYIVLYCAGNINHAIARDCLSDAFLEGLLRNVHEPLGQHATPSDGDGLCRVSNKTVVNDSVINTYDVPKEQEARAGQAMDHLLID